MATYLAARGLIVRNWLAFCGSVVAIEMLFTVAGLPLALLWRTERTVIRLAASPVLGIALLATFGWFWSRAGVSGLAPIARPLLIVLVLITGVVALVLRARVSGPLLDLREAAVAVVAWLAALVLVGFISAPIVGIGYRTSAVLPNTDIASYALMSQHLADHTVRDSDTLTGVDLSTRAESDMFGAAVVLALSAGLLGTEVWKLTLPVMAVAWMNLAVLLTALARRRLRVRGAPALVVSLTAVASSFFTTVALSYFLGQLLGLGFLVVLLLMLTQEGLSDEARSFPWKLVALLTVPVAGLILTYPIFLLSAVPVIGAVSIVGAAIHRATWTAGGRVAFGLLGGGLLGAAILPDRVLLVAGTLVKQTSAEYGIPLRGVTPLAVLGLQRLPADLHRTALVGTVTVLTIVIVGIAVAVRRKYPFALETGLLLVFVLAGWLVLLATRGSSSYQTWKWISYFQPILVCAALALTTHAATWLWPRGQLRARGREVVLLGLGALLAITVLNGRSALRGFERRSGAETAMAGEGWVLVDQRLADLEHNSALRGLSEINVNLTPYWEEMWAAYFLRDIPRVNLMTTTYYGKVPPLPSAWTLQRVELTPETPGVRRIPVNDRYVLVDKPSAPVG